MQFDFLSVLVVFVFKFVVFILVVQGGKVCLPKPHLGWKSGEVLNRIFISFPGVSFNMLIHQNVCIDGLGFFSS